MDRGQTQPSEPFELQNETRLGQCPALSVSQARIADSHRRVARHGSKRNVKDPPVVTAAPGHGQRRPLFGLCAETNAWLGTRGSFDFFAANSGNSHSFKKYYCSGRSF